MWCIFWNSKYILIRYFFKALGIDVANSLVEDNYIDQAKNILKTYKEKNISIYLPKDIVLTKEFKNNSETKIVDTNKNFIQGYEGVDIGPKTIDDWSKTLKEAKTILWNGPLGVFEIENFSKGTNEIAKIISKIDCISIIGGGDSIAAINKLKLNNKFSHISTGGGASLEFIENKTLPAIEVLSNK